MNLNMRRPDQNSKISKTEQKPEAFVVPEPSKIQNPAKTILKDSNYRESKENFFKNNYEEKIKVLEEKLRKSEIEKAELDFKLTQRKDTNFESENINSITKLLYQENRELRKNIKDLNQEILLFRSERGQYADYKNKHKSIQEKLRLESKQICSKLLMEKENNNRFREKYKEIKNLLMIQKAKYNKILAIIKINDCFKLFIHKIFRKIINGANLSEHQGLKEKNFKLEFCVLENIKTKNSFAGIIKKKMFDS